ncbi:hypothetical protein [Deinococcus sp.]|uniref:hypothetical protein n=1 Tax=Deinococcus sp. TaxID=47478 RepID=UPI002869A3F4|nr:hypothetical protein [Deinococcus sp.]
MDGHSRLSPNYLLPNHTYIMKMSLIFAYRKTPNDDTWFLKEINCDKMKHYFSWNVKIDNLKAAPGTPGQPQIQFDEVK